MTISRGIRLRMRNVLDKICIENQNTSCVEYVFPENRAVYKLGLM